MFYFVLSDREKKRQTPENQFNNFVYSLNIEMKDFPAIQSSLIASPVQKTKIKQRAKQMEQMRAGRGQQIPRKVIIIMMRRKECRVQDQLSINERT